MFIMKKSTIISLSSYLALIEVPKVIGLYFLGTMGSIDHLNGQLLFSGVNVKVSSLSTSIGDRSQ